MSDLAIYPDLILQAAPAVKHVARHAAVAKPIIQHGVSYMSFLAYFIGGAVGLLPGFGLGWYVRGRGMTGVKIDIDNVKKELNDLKDKISGQATVAA